LDSADAARAAPIELALAGEGAMIGSYDLPIAAQTVERELVIATGNLREFPRVDGLVCENWSQPV
jgi:tRNA(fMet)-specific endonuclease VapC